MRTIVAGTFREADPGQWDQRGGLKGLKGLPLAPEVPAALPNVDPAVFSQFEAYLHSPKADPMTRWKILQRGFWVHGVNSLYDLAREISRFEVSSVAHNITWPKLLTRGSSSTPIVTRQTPAPIRISAVMSRWKGLTTLNSVTAC
jgi:hypothetical protein